MAYIICCRGWRSALCALDQVTKCKVSLICDLHDRAMGVPLCIHIGRWHLPADGTVFCGRCWAGADTSPNSNTPPPIRIS